MATDAGEAGRSSPPRRSTFDDVILEGSDRDLRLVPRLIADAFRLVWAAAPRQFAMAATLQLVGGLALAAQLLVIRRVLDTVVVDDAVPILTELADDLLLLGLLLTVVAATAVAQREQQTVLAELVGKYTTARVLDVATDVELLEFDRPAFFDRLQRARVNASVRPIQIANGVLGLVGSGAAVAAVGAALLWIEPLVAGIIAVGALPAMFFNRLSSRALHAFHVRQTPQERRRAYLYQVLTRKEEAQEVRAFDSADHLRGEHDRLYDERIVDLRWTARRRMLYGLASGVTAAFVTVAALGLLVVFVRQGRLDLADAAVAVGAVVIVAGRLRGLIGSSGALYEGALFLRDFTDFVDAGARSKQMRAASVEQLPPPETIELERVSFTYPSRDEPSLRDVSLTIRHGEVIALVGENGSGKTTLTKLLAGLYRPTAGTMRWNGDDLADADLSAIREHVAVIFQDFARYFLTAGENVAISRVERLEDGAAVRRAAAAAGADAFLSDLPSGYATLLGPAFAGGSDLSVGQWQRIALARAYFRDSPVLILDEPTASLDPRGEEDIFRQVRHLAAGHTVILVSHRFSSVRAADRIIVLDGGRIAEEGSHASLMADGGLYAELFSLQAQGYGTVGS